MKLNEKCAYLRGLAEGMKLDTEKAEGKLIAGLLDLVSDIATAVEFDGVRVGVCDLAAQYVKDSFSNNLYFNLFRSSDGAP